MHVISRKALADFWKMHASARGPMTAWFKVVEGATFVNFASVRNTFNSADTVRRYTIFNVGGHGYRIVTAIHYNRQKLYIRHVFTHTEYERWSATIRRDK